MSATDPAVTAAAEARRGPEPIGDGTWHLPEHWIRYADDDAMQCICGWNADGDPERVAKYRLHEAEYLVATLRPIIEAEVIARLAAKWQSLADHDPLCGMGTEAQHLHGCGTPVCVCLPVAEVRERIAADIEAEAARRTARIISPYDRAHRDGLLSAARIARGQS